MIGYKLLKQEYEVFNGKYRILCDVENNKLTVTTPQGKSFSFINSDPLVVKTIGEMIAYAAKLVEVSNVP